MGLWDTRGAEMFGIFYWGTSTVYEYFSFIHVHS